ncbi:MAG: hypothetical protein JHC93_08680 [Parachlamydiales bacterium]|nr:hypothetical protein [Parachlamydiales bacterium]
MLNIISNHNAHLRSADPVVLSHNRNDLYELFHKTVTQFTNTLAQKTMSKVDNEELAISYAITLWNETAEELKLDVSLTGDKIKHLHLDHYLKMFNEGSEVSQKFLDRFELKIQDFNHSLQTMPWFLRVPEKSSNIRMVSNPSGVENLSAEHIKDNNEKISYLTRIGLKIAKSINNQEARNIAVLQILSMKTGYTEKGTIESLKIPSLTKLDHEVEYSFSKDVFNGLVMWSGIPISNGDSDQPPLVIFQGTTLGNYHKHSIKKLRADTDDKACGYKTFEEFKDYIEQRLKTIHEITGFKPIIMGHSLGGSLANLTGLYLNKFIDYSVSFNSPGVADSIWNDYLKLTPSQKDRINSYANLDDFAFWTVRGKVIGRPYLLSGVKRVKRCEDFKASHSELTAIQSKFFIVKTDEELENIERKDRISQVFQRYFHFLGRIVLTVVVYLKYMFSSHEEKKQLRLERIVKLNDLLAIAKQKYYDSMEIEESLQTCEPEIKAKFDHYSNVYLELEHQLKVFKNSYSPEMDSILSNIQGLCHDEIEKMQNLSPVEQTKQFQLAKIERTIKLLALAEKRYNAIKVQPTELIDEDELANNQVSIDRYIKLQKDLQNLRAQFKQFFKSHEAELLYAKLSKIS